MLGCRSNFVDASSFGIRDADLLVVHDVACDVANIAVIADLLESVAQGQKPVRRFDHEFSELAGMVGLGNLNFKLHRADLRKKTSCFGRAFIVDANKEGCGCQLRGFELWGEVSFWRIKRIRNPQGVGSNDVGAARCGCPTAGRLQRIASARCVHFST